MIFFFIECIDLPNVVQVTRAARLRSIPNTTDLFRESAAKPRAQTRLGIDRSRPAPPILRRANGDPKLINPFFSIEVSQSRLRRTRTTRGSLEARDFQRPRAW